MKHHTTKDDKVPTFRLMAFALPNFMAALMRGPTAGILPAIYAKYHGLDLTTVGTVLMITRIFDAVTDPVIGYLSDRTKSRLGRRKPWIITGYGLSVVVIYYLFIPPEKITAMFFLFWFAMMYLAWTVAEIPYNAWAMELSRDYRQRSRIMTYRSVFGMLGGILFAVMPLMPFFKTSAITPGVIKVLGYCVIAGLPLSVAVAMIFAPEGKTVAVRESTNIKELYASIKNNKPFQLFLAVVLLFGLAGGAQGAMVFLAIDTFYLIGDKFPYMLLMAALLGLAALPVWLHIIYRFGKIHSYLGLQLSYVAVLPFFALIKPGAGAFIPFVALYCLAVIIYTGSEILPGALLGDVIDFDILKTGANRSGQYTAALTLIGKFNAAIGSGAAFFIVGLFGYDATKTQHSALASFGLKSMMIWAPLVLTVIAIFFLWRFPLTERRQNIIKRRIESRAARAQRDAGQDKEPKPGL